MLVNTRTIKNMDTVLSTGQMVESTSENGAKESNTEKELILKKERKDSVSGKWARESNGLKIPMEANKNDLNLIQIGHSIEVKYLKKITLKYELLNFIIFFN